MIKKLVSLILAACACACASVAPVTASLEDCSEYSEYGIPGSDGTLLCRMGYLLAHDEQFLTPIWVAERLTREKVAGKAVRKDNFKPDPDLLPGKRAELTDYKGSGYDRGHMAPAADMKWHQKAMDESFYLSNIIPQNSNNNQQIWATLETHVRDWVLVRGEIIVYSGPIHDNDEANLTIGNNKVAVPDRLYKVIYDPFKKEAIAFLMPNQPINAKFLPNYIVTVREIENITGLDFLSRLPRKEQNRIEKTKATMWDRK
ncbi:MAG: DNA/RNA non-specific endonuclease [Azoarcus sp.]|jgi:endonuclease G|nr:DNA/RNA non-specific endonuclease [Azoarcus sp.]